MNEEIPDVAPQGSVEDFDFLVGRWNVRHRRLVGRLAGSTTWEEFDGESELRTLMGGQANVDDNVIHLPGGTYRAITVRVFDAGARAWSIYWFDARYPTAVADPLVGGFAGGRGLFFADDELDGRPIRVRFVWHADDRDSCRWEQAFSADGGRTWETNWYMSFTRADESSRAVPS